MDFLLEALGEIAGEIFASVAHLLNLDLDIVFVYTTSTYFELDIPDELAELQDKVDDDGVSRPLEQGKRSFGHSKDFRTDLPQVVITMAVTRDGVPVRCWTFPGNTADTSIIRTVKDDLAGWNLRRMVWVADRGFASAANRAYLSKGGGYYIHAGKLRHTNSDGSGAEGGDLGGEVVGEGVDHRQCLTGLAEFGVGVAGVFDLVLLPALGEGALSGVVAHGVGERCV